LGESPEFKPQTTKKKKKIHYILIKGTNNQKK
jgi:hypothetical protein